MNKLLSDLIYLLYKIHKIVSMLNYLLLNHANNLSVTHQQECKKGYLVHEPNHLDKI